MKKLIGVVLFLVAFLPVMGQKGRVTNQKIELEKSKRFAPAPTVFYVGTVKQLVSEGKPLPYQYVLEENGQLHALQGENLDRYANQEVYITGRLQKDFVSVTNLQLVEPYASATTAPEVRHIQFPYYTTEMDYEPKKLFADPDFPPVTGLWALGEPYITLPTPTWGTQPVLSIMFTFAGNPQQPLTQTSVESLVYTGATTEGYSANDYFQEASAGRFSISGSSFGWIVINDDPSVNCSMNLTQTMFNHVMAQVPDSLKAQYHRYILFYPQQSGCPGPISTVGIRGDTTGNQYSWIPVTVNSLTAENMAVTLNSVTHEFGHQLGMSHAQALALTGQLGNVNDRASLMTDRLRYPNPYERLVLGWFAGKLVVVNSAATGNFTLLSPAMFQIRQQKILLVPLYNPDTSFANQIGLIETRTDLQNYYELFNGTQYAPFATGWAWRICPSDMSALGTKSTLIDTTDNFPNFDDAAVQPGVSFTDTNWGVTIQVIGPSPNGLAGRVTSSRVP